MTKQKTKYVILGLLTIGPLTGYDMRKFIGKSISHFWSESNGQLYPALNQLVKEKLIVLEQTQHTGKKVSHLYSITDEGRAKLEQWLQEREERKPIHRDEELLKLFFGKNVPSVMNVDLLRRREKKVKEKLEEYFSIQKEIEKYAASPHYLYWTLNLNYGIGQAGAELRWCEESLRLLCQQNES